MKFSDKIGKESSWKLFFFCVDACRPVWQRRPKSIGGGSEVKRASLDDTIDDAMQCKFCTLWMEKFRQATETCFTQFMFFCSHNSAVSVSSNTIYRRRVMFWIFDLRSCWISFLRRDGEHFWSGLAFLLIHFCCCRIEYERQRNVSSASAWCLFGCPTTEDANYLNTAATENDEWHLLWVDCHH